MGRSKEAGHRTMPAGKWVVAAESADVPPGEVRAARIPGRILALANVDGAVHAVDGVCPHQKGPLWQGRIWRGQIECPWHHFRFDPASGANTYPANVYPDDVPGLEEILKPVRTFPVRVEDGRIWVWLEEKREKI